MNAVVNAVVSARHGASSARARGTWLLMLAAVGCSSNTDNLVSDPLAHDAAVHANADAGASPAGSDAGTTFTTNAQGHVLCGNKLCACDDGNDNDGDGLVDGLDPECTGPYDDDEASFATGVHKGGNPMCLDCFFDDNTSSQDDGCYYNAACLDGKPPPGMGSAMCSSCQVSSSCIDSCQKRTPNGCDCFGCCEVVMAGQASVFVKLTDSCSLDKVGSKKDCPPCTQSTQCRNDCGPCELCLGRTAQDLDPKCAADGGAPKASCDNQEPHCGANNACPQTYYCHLGCCLPVLL